MSTLVSILKARGLRKGVFGGDRTWFAVWAALTAVSVVRWVLRERPAKPERFTLKPGQGLLVTDAGATRADFAAGSTG